MVAADMEHFDRGHPMTHRGVVNFQALANTNLPPTRV
jgi:hypothetical protein